MQGFRLIRHCQQLAAASTNPVVPQPASRRAALIGLSSGALGVAHAQQPAAGSRSLAAPQRAGTMPETPKGMSRGGSPWVCRTCGLQYTATETPPEKCKTCLDERQYVGADVSLLSMAYVSAATVQLPLVVVRQDLLLSPQFYATSMYGSMHVAPHCMQGPSSYACMVCSPCS